MATYVIGDVQGCWDSLRRLLDLIDWDPSSDQAWIAGDLVNRGPRSLEVLRWARSVGDALTCVLGNHDLHLLARAEGARERKSRDTLEQVLAAPDRDELLDWLRGRPLLHREGRCLLVHAGILPSWSADDAEEIARRTEEVLRERGAGELARHQSRDEARRWQDSGDDVLRAATALNVFTRMRCLRSDGTLDLDYSGPPEDAPDGLVPWHEVPGRRHADARTCCGHWAAQGLVVRDDLVAVDTAVVWGGAMTAVRLDDLETFQVEAVEPPATG